MPPRTRSRLRGPEKMQVQHSYAAVYVLLFSWEHDDLGVDTEIRQLDQVFGQAYGFWVERFLIPNEEPDEAIAEVLKDFVRKYQSPRSLLIVYYGGHGKLNDARLALWSCTCRDNSPQAKWYSHQLMLENSTADVLLLLDCCSPMGGGGSVHGTTSKLVLAACGFRSEAPGVGEHSFSRALIQELLKSPLQPFTMAELHHRILNRLRNMVPDHRGEQRETPVLSVLGEGGYSDPSIRLVSYAVHPVNLIALMGDTGSGKSSLINRICGKAVADVGGGQESMTKEVMDYVTVVNGETLTLIDTPGFDDTYLSDRQVLERISTYFFKHYQDGCKLSGLLYLRDINLPKMNHSALKSLDMFQRLCGNESLRNVMLLTTKWDKSAEFAQSHESHEEELKNKFWATMISLGCSHPMRLGATVDRSSSIVDPISDIITPMLRFQPTWLRIQQELGKGKPLIDTEAGQYVDRELSAAIAEHKRNAESALVQAEKTFQEQVKAALASQAEDHQSELKIAKKDKVALKEDFEKVMEAEAKRRSKLFGVGMLNRLENYASELKLNGKIYKFLTDTFATLGLFQACKYIWKMQGVSQDLIDAKDAWFYGVGDLEDELD